jgi:hypothetical protein
MWWADDVWPMRWADDVWPMRWAYDAVYSWLGGVLSMRAHEISCRVRAGEATQPAFVSGWNVVGFAPKGRNQLQVRFRVDPVGSPGSIHGVVVSRLTGGACREREGRPAIRKHLAGLGHDGNV